MHQLRFIKPPLQATKKILWTTDLHLDAADQAEHLKFIKLVENYAPDLILIGGDISNGSNSLVHLKILSDLIAKPIYFVLGNHDFYYGSIQPIREQAKALTQKHPEIFYLTDGGVVALTKTTALIGHDGWSDGRAGKFLESDIALNDYFFIDELKDLSPPERLKVLNQLGDASSAYLENTLIQAFKKFDQVILLTHVPPYIEACVYDEEGVASENWSPHFVNQATGEALLRVMQAHPQHQLLVLCGHTHASADIHKMANLHVLAGESALGKPSIQGEIYIN